MSEGVNLRISSPIEATMVAKMGGWGELKEPANFQMDDGCYVTEAVQGFKKGFD